MAKKKNENLEKALKKVPKTLEIIGYGINRTIYLQGKLLDIVKSQSIVKHSAEFNWGYAGSGPAQLALALCLHYMPKTDSLKVYQDLKEVLIQRLPDGSFKAVVQMRDVLERLIRSKDGETLAPVPLESLVKLEKAPVVEIEGHIGIIANKLMGEANDVPEM